MQKKKEIVDDYYSLVGLKTPVEKTAPLKDQPVNTTIKPIPKPSLPSRRTRRRSSTIGGKKYKTKKSIK